jgi:hypothetical protein
MTSSKTLHIEDKAWELLKIAATKKHSTMSELASKVLESAFQETFET